MHKYPLSKKHKTLWITYNDDDVADSHFCIQYLNKKFSKYDQYNFLDPEQVQWVLLATRNSIHKNLLLIVSFLRKNIILYSRVVAELVVSKIQCIADFWHALPLLEMKVKHGVGIDEWPLFFQTLSGCLPIKTLWIVSM